MISLSSTPLTVISFVMFVEVELLLVKAVYTLSETGIM